MDAKYKCCATCGCSFWAPRLNQIYCSAACRKRQGRRAEIILPIKKKWFDMLLSGKKKEEYRERTPYWRKRIENVFHWAYGNDGTGEWNWHWSRMPEEVTVRNGYRKDSPSATFLCHLEEREGNPEWGAEEGKKYFVFVVHGIVRVENVLDAAKYREKLARYAADDSDIADMGDAEEYAADLGERH